MKIRVKFRGPARCARGSRLSGKDVQKLGPGDYVLRNVTSCTTFRGMVQVNRASPPDDAGRINSVDFPTDNAKSVCITFDND